MRDLKRPSEREEEEEECWTCCCHFHMYPENCDHSIEAKHARSVMSKNLHPNFSAISVSCSAVD